MYVLFSTEKNEQAVAAPDTCPAEVDAHVVLDDRSAPERSPLQNANTAGPEKSKAERTQAAQGSAHVNDAQTETQSIRPVLFFADTPHNPRAIFFFQCPNVIITKRLGVF